MKQKILLALGCVLMASGAWASDYTLTLYADGCNEPNTFTCSSGQQLSINATPMEHRHLVMWSDGNTDNPRLVTMNQNLTYTAIFASDSFNVSVAASPTSYGSVSGAGLYEYNSSARLTATANYGYKFSKWNDGNTSNPRTVTVTADKTYTATFVKQSYSISVASSNTSWGSVSGAGTYDYLTNVTIKATPNYGYHFTQWSDGNTDNPHTITLTSDTILTAEFAKNEYTISATSNNTAYGTVSGGGSALYLSSKQLTATAKYGYHFVKWYDGNTANPRTITVERDSSFVAEFAPNQYQCNASCDNTRGTVSVNALNANFSINLKDSYGDGWSGNKLTVTDGTHSYDCTISTGKTASYNITYYGLPYTFYWTKGSYPEECSFEVTCNGKTYSVTGLSAYKTGDIISLTGQSTYEYLSQVTLTATSKYGYHFTKWSDNRTNNPHVFTITKDTTFTAIFDPNTYSIQTSVADTACGYTIGDTVAAYLSSVDILAVPNYGYLFNRWTDGNTSNPRTISVTRDSSFQATFTKKYFNLQVTTTNSSCGSVSGSGSYQYLSERTISASPEYGYHFDSWSDGNTENPRTITMLSDTTFTATFAPNTYIIFTSATEGGMTKGDTSVLYREPVVITAIPNYGYEFNRWSDGNTNNPRTVYANGDATYVAQFVKTYFRVSVSSDNTTMGTTSGSGRYQYQNDVTIRAYSQFGYEFKQWNDGNTDNPRIVYLESDTSFVASFYLVYEGECGQNLQWKYQTGLLTISGIGDMYNFTSTTTPWILFRDSIENVVIEHGATSIGDYAFYGCNNRAFTKLVMPQSVKAIGNYAFANCNRLTSVVFSNDLEEVGDYAFSGCTRINDMTIYATITPDAYDHTFAGVNTMAYLYVLPGSVRTYRLDPIWGVFDIQSIGAETTTVTTSTVEVVPGDNEAEFTWPTNNAAASYSLTITKDGIVFCTLTFNANGQLTGLAFAPGRNGAEHAAAATTSVAGMTFTVTGLDAATAYAFSFDAKNASQQVIESYTGTFETAGYQAPETPTELEHVDGVNKYVNTPTKVVRDGQVLIQRGDRLYDLRGQEVK